MQLHIIDDYTAWIEPDSETNAWALLFVNKKPFILRKGQEYFINDDHEDYCPDIVCGKDAKLFTAGNPVIPRSREFFELYLMENNSE